MPSRKLKPPTKTQILCPSPPQKMNPIKQGKDACVKFLILNATEAKPYFFFVLSINFKNWQRIGRLRALSSRAIRKMHRKIISKIISKILIKILSKILCKILSKILNKILSKILSKILNKILG